MLPRTNLLVYMSACVNPLPLCPPPQNVDILKDPETVKQLGSILKTNVRACKAVGHPFVIQLGRIYLDMLNVYKCLSENISAAIQTNGKGGVCLSPMPITRLQAHLVLDTLLCVLTVLSHVADMNNLVY